MQNLIVVVGLCGNSLFLETDHFHQNGETIVATSYHEEPGGKGYNQAVTIKKMGGNVHFIGCIGNDNDGKVCEEYLNSQNIAHTFIKTDVATTKAVILTNKDGDNEVTVFPGASQNLKILDLKPYLSIIQKASYLLLTYELEENLISYLMKFAKEHHIKVIINPAPYKHYNKEILSLADLITPNLCEASQLFACSKEKIKEKVKNSSYNIIVTLGNEGVLLKTNDLFLQLPLVINPTVIDTTGAGDCFNGTLVAFLARGASIIESTFKAILASNLSVKSKYVLDSIPYINDLELLHFYHDIYYPYHKLDKFRRTSRAFLLKDDKIGLLWIEGTDIFGTRHHLETCGGGNEGKESDEETILREILEETGYQGKIVASLGFIVHEFNLLNLINLAHYYVVKVEESNYPIIRKENENIIKGLKWFTLDEIKIELLNSISQCDKLVHNRELLALQLFINNFVKE